MKSKLIGELVIARCSGAGIHIGTLTHAEWRSGSAHIQLVNDMRLWRWKECHTLHEVSVKGIPDDYKRLSEPVQYIELFDVHEILPVSAEAAQSLTTPHWTE